MATMVVSQSEFEAFQTEHISPLYTIEDIKVSDTPKDDVRAIEVLLGMEDGSLVGKHTLFFRAASSPKAGVCPCGRTTSFLDIMHSALMVHSKEFLKSTILGKKGFVISKTVPIIQCCSCGRQVKELKAYNCKAYSC